MSSKSKLTVPLFYERRGRGTPLLLLHGYPLDHSIWEPLVQQLETRADLILPDLRGFGRSGISNGKYSIEEMAADVGALLDHLKIEKAIIAGHSMGGYIALAFAKALPERTTGLGLISSQAASDTPERRAGRYQTLEQVKAQGVSVVADAMTQKLTPNPELHSKIDAIIRAQKPEGVMGALRALAERPDFTPDLPRFQLPVAIIHGLEDALIPVERAREVYRTLPEGYMVELNGVGHMPMMEAPRSTAEALESLL